MKKIIVWILGAGTVYGAVAWLPAPLSAQSPTASSTASAPPDFTGVYYPEQQGRGGQGRRAGAPPADGQRGGPPPRPTQSAPLSDGSQGRAPDAPSLRPEYLA